MSPPPHHSPSLGDLGLGVEEVGVARGRGDKLLLAVGLVDCLDVRVLVLVARRDAVCVVLDVGRVDADRLIVLVARCRGVDGQLWRRAIAVAVDGMVAVAIGMAVTSSDRSHGGRDGSSSMGKRSTIAVWEDASNGAEEGKAGREEATTVWSSVLLLLVLRYIVRAAVSVAPVCVVCVSNERRREYVARGGK